LKAALADRYAIEGELGRGGMATVYLAHDLRHDRKVAVKVLRSDLAESLGSERFLQEIKTTARLSHPHILSLYDSGAAGEFLFYVMPYVEGESLRERLRRERQLPLEDALAITREIADALSYAHSHGVIHRDIKPENILLESGHALVADFGVAKAIHEGGGDAALTRTGFAVGTPAYMSPEQASGDQYLDARSDIYALGSVLYEMLAGEPPHTGPTPQAILARQLSGEVHSLQPVRSTVTPVIDGAIKRALAPAPADRYATAREFIAALQGRGALLRRSSAVLSIVVTRRSLRAVALAAGVVVALAVAGAVLFDVLPPAPLRAGERPAAVAVFPFRATGGEAGALGETVADLLAATIDGTVGVTVSDPGGLWRPLRRGDELYVPNLDEAAQLARQSEIPNMVLGSLTAIGGRLDLTARVYDDVGELRASLTASAPAESLPALVNRLAIDVVAELWERDTLPTVPIIERYATSSVDALKKYLEGKRLKRLGQYERAQTVLQEAVAVDSTFALALMELASTTSWVLYLRAQPFVGLTPIVDQAMRYRERLMPRNRWRVEALHAMNRTEGARADSLYQQILEQDSLDVDAVDGRAFTHLTNGWQIGKGLDDVLDSYRRAAELDPQSIVSNATHAWLTVLANEPQATQQAIRTLLTLDTLGPFVQGRLAAIRILQASAAERESLLTRVAAAPTPVVFTALRDLRQMRPRVAEQFLERLLPDTMPLFHQRIGQGATAQLWLGEGKVAALDGRIRSGTLDPLRQALNRALVSAALLGVGDSLALVRAVSELEAYAPMDSLAAYLDRRAEVWGAAWSIGAYHAAFGDTVVARQWQRAIAALPQGDTPWDWRGALADDIDGRVAVRRGDADAARRAAERAYAAWLIHSGYVNEADPELAIRFRLAEILRAQGEDNRAAGLFQSFQAPHTWMGFFTARAALELAEIREAQGQREAAIRHYQTAEQLWQSGEPDVVRPWLQRVREGLRRLQAG
jgi:tetratricopeptide (TPR) repeat protein